MFHQTMVTETVASGSSEHTRMLVESGAAEGLIALLGSRNWEVREQAVWALGNVAGDGPASRDALLARGLVPALVALVTAATNTLLPPSLMRNAAWALASVFRGRPGPALPAVQAALPTLAALVRYPDPEVATDALWGAAYATDGGDARADAALAAGLVDAVLRALPAAPAAQQLPALRTLGNVVAGTAPHLVPALLARGAGPVLVRVASDTSSTSRAAQREALWALANIAADSPAAVAALVAAGAVPVVVGALAHAPDAGVRREAAWALGHCLATAADAQLAALAAADGVAAALARALAFRDTALVLLLLRATARLLAAAPPAAAVAFEEAGGAARLEELQEHVDNDVYAAAADLIDTYFTDTGVPDEPDALYARDDGGDVACDGDDDDGSSSSAASTPLFATPEPPVSLSTVVPAPPMALSEVHFFQ